jgi:probable rRNA maturation factor
MITLEPPQGVPEGAAGWNALALSRAGLLRFLSSAMGLVGIGGEVNVLLAGDATLQRLNTQFRGKKKSTDVLSFPAMGQVAPRHAGDLAISLDTAQRQAAEHSHTLAVEVRILMLHGLLHLAGMDHETDHGQMAAREAELRKRLRLPSGLIARTEEFPATAKPATKSPRTRGAKA